LFRHSASIARKLSGSSNKHPLKTDKIEHSDLVNQTL
jgi:hypothetical protein